MVLELSILALLYLTISITATPTPLNNAFITLPLITDHTSGHNKSLSDRRTSGSLVKDASTSYIDVEQLGTLTIGAKFGINQIQQRLLVDTGSAILTVGRTVSSQQQIRTAQGLTDLGTKLTGKYGSGETYTAEKYTGPVIFGGMTPTDLMIALYDQAVNNPKQTFDGILGLGPQALSKGQDLSNVAGTVPSTTSTVCGDGSGGTTAFALYIEPSNDLLSNSGILSFCGYDENFGSALPVFSAVAPITPNNGAPGFYFWALGIQAGYIVGDATIPQAVVVPLAGALAIIDSGGNGIKLNTAAFASYIGQVGGMVDPSGWIKIAKTDMQRIPTLRFMINGQSYDLIPDAQILPQAQAQAATGVNYDPNSYYLRVQELTSSGGWHYDLILGTPFLERFYTVYNADDPQNPQIGLSKTTCTNTIVTNCPAPANPPGPANPPPLANPLPADPPPADPPAPALGNPPALPIQPFRRGCCGCCQQ